MELAKLTAKDVEICKSFKALVLQGKFEVEGSALVKTGALFKWFNTLDQRIAETIKEPPPETVRKELNSEGDSGKA